jgi:hypothetical protein
MTQRSIGRIAGAAALTAILALAAPAQAAGWRITEPAGAGWLEAALQWMAGVWPGGAPAERAVTEPSPPTVTAPPPPKTDSGFGIDPDG